ncbi:hypothetical protein AB4089_15550 [Arthrobacter sp. 2MCAF15]|uniref:hypothetical protein n=1 Tax=Arthrobacter sp. 2MCAF15 TaxID=3232984 RepID=UPI003F904753
MNRTATPPDGAHAGLSDEPERRSVITVVFEEGDVSAEVALADGAKVLAAANEETLELLEQSSADAGHDYMVYVQGAAVRAALFNTAASSNFNTVIEGVKARAFKADIVDGAVVGIPQVLEVVAQQPALIEATEAAGRLVSQLTDSMAALAPSLAAKEGFAVSPQVAYALAQEEQDLRAIEDEFGWLDSGGVAEQMGKKRSRTLASNLRARGQLLGYVRRGQQAVRFPKFQFDGMGVLPVIPDLIRIANERGVAQEDLIFWLCAPTGMLEEDARPVDKLRADPDAVLAAARYDIGGHSW